MSGAFFSRIIAAVTPKEEKYFRWFEDLAAVVLQGASQLAAMSAEPTTEFEARYKAIRELEGKADQITREILLSLHRTFITPLDRTEIKDLAAALDDVIDYIEDVPMRSAIYGGSGAFTAEMASLGQIVYRAAEKLHEAVGLISDMGNADRIMKICAEVSEIEDDADRVMRNGMARLFQEESDARALLRTKELYELYEEAVDRCQDAAEVIHGIVLERI
jgi:predicted phosphate transport protein (TIGR00153 family)